MGNMFQQAFGVISTIWSDNSGFDRVKYLFVGVLWQIRRRLGHTFVVTLSNGAKAKIYPAAPFSGAFYSRIMEPKDTIFLRKHAGLSATFVDVGANVGLFSASLFDKYSRFYLFEPAQSSFRVLEETCALNPSIECTAMNIAVSDKQGTLEFLDEGNFSTTSRAIGVAGNADTRICRVPADTLDNILGGEVASLVLKVDVEGFEEKVFLGATKLFESNKVKLVLFERLGRTDFVKIKAFFDEMRYVLFFVNEAGRVVLDKTALEKPLINLFACPEAIFPSISTGSDVLAISKHK